MTAVVVHPRLVRVTGWLRERYAVPSLGGRWLWDHTGRAVCPLVQAAIDRAIRHALEPPG